VKHIGKLEDLGAPVAILSSPKAQLTTARQPPYSVSPRADVESGNYFTSLYSRRRPKDEGTREIG
jgi:hypothetical protein